MFFAPSRVHSGGDVSFVSLTFRAMRCGFERQADSSAAAIARLGNPIFESRGTTAPAVTTRCALLLIKVRKAAKQPSYSELAVAFSFHTLESLRRPVAGASAVDAQSKDVAIPWTFRLARAIHLKRCVTARLLRSVDAGDFVYRPGRGYKA